METMQDVTPFTKDGESVAAEERRNEIIQNSQAGKEVAASAPDKGAELTTSITMAGLFDKYPYLKEWFVALSPTYSKLKNPVVFAAMGRIATLDMVAQRSGFEPEALLEKVKTEIDRHEREE